MKKNPNFAEIHSSTLELSIPLPARELLPKKVVEGRMGTEIIKVSR